MINDLILKLKMLWLYRSVPRQWYHEVWRQDPDAVVCCSGHECGCWGVCHADMWNWAWERRQ